MEKAILGKIFTATEVPTPRTLLLTDTVEICGRGLLYSLISAHLRLGTDVIYLTTTLAPQCIQSHIINNDNTEKLLIIDGASDPSDWDTNGQGVSLSQPLPHIFNNRHESGGDADRKVVLVVDKVEHLLCHQKPLELVRGLHALAVGEKLEQVIMYGGRDTIEESTLSALTHAAAATIHLMPTFPLTCHLVLKKPSGKILKSHEEFRISPELEILDVRLVQSQTQPLSTVDDNTTDNILASQTTFSLTLTSNQRTAKNNLLLPHTRIQSGESGGGGLIHYTPDDADDWDDDDPDDDLDI